MSIFKITFILVLIFFMPVFGHEHWIDIDNYYPDIGQKNTVYICSGHYFPESSIIISEKLINSFTVISSDSQSSNIKTVENQELKNRYAEINIKSSGTNLLCFILKKKQEKEPLFWAKSIMIAGNENPEQKYEIGEGLEIVPLKIISSVKAGDDLPIKLVYNGEQIESTLSIMSENGNSGFKKTKKDQPVFIKINKNGRYFISTSFTGKGCSLTFYIK